MDDDIDTANYADLKTLEDRVRRTLFAHGFNEKTSTPLGDMNSLCRNLVQDAAATDAELQQLRTRVGELEGLLRQAEVTLRAEAKAATDAAERDGLGLSSTEARCNTMAARIEAALRGGEGK